VAVRELTVGLDPLSLGVCHSYTVWLRAVRDGEEVGAKEPVDATGGVMLPWVQ
jgi:hypothetical protein